MNCNPLQLDSGNFSNRRGFLSRCVLGATALAAPGAFAEALVRTPRQTEGPFYPDKLPLDTDNDLLILNDSMIPAVGEVTHLTGRVLDSRGEPARNVEVEIWQADAKGAYIHSRSRTENGRDGNFQGFGRFLTGRKGEYYFRTIKPVPYPGRTPHIHFAINKGGKRLLTTQIYIKGEPQNQRDRLVQRISDPKVRESVMVEFKPLEDSPADELAAHFEIVLGWTPEA